MSRKGLTKEQRLEIFNMFDGHCGYCGTDVSDGNFNVDHIEPVHLGGKCEMANFLPSCASCNSIKSTMTIEDFKSELEKKHERLLRENAKYRTLFRYGIIEKVKSEITFLFED